MSTPEAPVATTTEAKTEYEVARLNPIARMINTLFSPGETFQDINRKPGWIVPFLLAIVFAVSGNFIVLQRLKVDWNKMAVQVMDQQKEKVEKRGGTMPDLSKEQKEQQLKFVSQTMRITTLVAPWLAPPIMIFLFSLLFWGATAIMGGMTTYKKVLSVTAHITSMVIFGAQTVLSIIVAFVRNPEDINLLKGSIAVTNPGMLLPDGSNAALLALLTRLDIFSIWFLALMIIGLTAVSKNMTTGKSFAIVVGLWTVYVVAAVVLAAIFN